MVVSSVASPLDQVYIGSRWYAVKTSRTRATVSGNTQAIPAVAGSKIRPLSYSVGPVSAAVTVTVQDAAGTPVVLLGPFDCAVNGGIVDETPKNTDQEGTVSVAVNINLSVDSNVTVHLRYIEVPG